MAACILFVPCLAFATWMLAHTPAAAPFDKHPVLRFLCSALMCALFAALGFSYSHVINAFTGSFDTVFVHGPVVKKETRSGGWAGTRRMVTLVFEGREVMMAQTAEEYEKAKLGETYGLDMRLGGLGYYWRPGPSYWK